METLPTGQAKAPSNRKETMSSDKIKTSWWSLTIQDYPNFKPDEADLEHIAQCIKDGYDQGQLIQEVENECN